MSTITTGYTEQEKITLIKDNGYEVMAMKVTTRSGRSVSSSDVNFAYKKGIKYTIDEAYLNVVLLLLDTPTNTAAHASSHISSGADVIPTFTAALTGLVPLSGGGTVKYLRADGTWAVPGGTGMVYPDAGIALSTGSAWGTSITNNSANWNTAYGWGDHASEGYLTSLGTALVDADFRKNFAIVRKKRKQRTVRHRPSTNKLPLRQQTTTKQQT
jgi:hypothetical protein